MSGGLNQQRTRVSYFNKIYLFAMFELFINHLLLWKNHMKADKLMLATAELWLNKIYLFVTAEICVQNKSDKLMFLQ
jgi:hypothetical protein